MKKYLSTILAAAAVFAACTKFAEDAEITYASIEAPAVTAMAVSDSAVTMTLEPKQGTAYYSYVVAEGAATEVDPVNLLKGKSGIKALVVNEKEIAAVIEVKAEAVEDTKATATLPLGKLTLELTDLKPNTKYTIYAVASNDQGVVSKLATATAVTTDELAPEFVDYDAAEEDSVMVYQLLFNDPVKLSGEGELKVHFYARNYFDATTKICPELMSLTIDPENISDNGGIITFEIPKDYYVPGANVDVTWSAGFVENALGLPCAAFPYTGYYYDQKGTFSAIGLAVRYKAVDFAFSYFETEEEEDAFLEVNETEDGVEPEIVYYMDWKELMMKAYARSAGQLVKKTTNAKVTVTVEDSNGRIVSYPTASGILDAGTVGVMLSEEPGISTTASFTIAAGSFEDTFGNTNKEFELDCALYYCSYGYTIEDIAGTYTFNFNSPMSGSYTNIITISASDDDERGNVMLNGQMADVDVKIYGNFNFDNGELELESLPVVGTCQDYIWISEDEMVTDDEGNPILFDMEVVLGLSTGGAPYEYNLGFDVPAAHQLVPWYSKYFWALFEQYGEKLIGFYDALTWTSSPEYTPDAEQAAAPALVSFKSRKYIGVPEIQAGNPNLER
ncbi:MAG: hypothetical protein PUA47_05930 [Bacteroidales bacterium]|nr:hypothetical protein [Bacteroidales bacterium]